MPRAPLPDLTALSQIRYIRRPTVPHIQALVAFEQCRVVTATIRGRRELQCVGVEIGIVTGFYRFLPVKLIYQFTGKSLLYR